MKNVLDAADAVCNSARSMNPGVPIGQSDAVVSGEKLMALHCALRESASSVVSGSGETVACEPGGEPPPPPPARTNAEKFWAALTAQQAFDLLKVAPKVAGPWLDGAVRKTPDGRAAAWKHGDDEYVFPSGNFGQSTRGTTAEVDAALRELGWTLVD